MTKSICDFCGCEIDTSLNTPFCIQRSFGYESIKYDGCELKIELCGKCGDAITDLIKGYISSDNKSALFNRCFPEESVGE